MQSFTSNPFNFSFDPNQVYMQNLFFSEYMKQICLNQLMMNNYSSMPLLFNPTITNERNINQPNLHTKNPNTNLKPVDSKEETSQNDCLLIYNSFI